MSQQSSFTGKFRASPVPPHQSPNNRVLKRTRESLVCAQCRASKTRCDRRQPCGSCIRRDVLCDYHQSSGSSADSGQIGDKLISLESVVKHILQTQTQTQAQAAELTASYPSGVAREGPGNNIEAQSNSQVDRITQATYVGSTHWTAVLNDLLELKALLHYSPELGAAQDGLPMKALHTSHESIFGAFSSFSLEKVISDFLPAKVDTDRLLSHFFQGPVFIIPMLHKYQFQRQYHEFWASPMQVQPLWLSILFSLCYISAEVRKITDPGGPPLKETFPDNFFLHDAAGQCLVLGEYNRPQVFAVEALGMYAQSKHVQNLDPSPEAGVVLSLAVRTAYHLGYHRDPSQSGRFAIFEGEMRRRCWAICKQMDLLTSFELGLPSNICIENCDTKSPRNLFDSDFDEDTQELPPSRSVNDATRQLWFIIKDRMMVTFSKICRDALSVDVKSEAEVLQLDRETRQMYETIPDVLRVKDMSESITESPFIIFTRICVEFVYLKCQCVLHRRYMAQGNAYSTKCCIDAGKKLVGDFIGIAREFSPGGQLYMQRWMLSNYTMNDFLLGVMVLCFVLYTGRNKSEQSFVDRDAKQEIVALLESSHSILVERSSRCRDARRVSCIVRQILDNSKEPSNPPVIIESPPGVANNLEVTQPQIPGPYNGSEPFSEPFDLFTFMCSPVGDFDWTAFDAEMSTQDASYSGL